MTAGVATNSTLYHLWGAKDALSFIVVAGTGKPEITVDWDALRNSSAGSITFQSKPSHVFGFVIPSVSFIGCRYFTFSIMKLRVSAQQGKHNHGL